MIKFKVKNAGITLIEILITISIIFLISAAVFGVLMMGRSYSDTAQSTVNVQQEANRFVFELTSWHEKNKLYVIHLDENPYGSTVSLIPYDDMQLLEDEKITISTEGFDYSICYDRSLDWDYCTNTSYIVNSKELPFKLLIRANKDKEIIFEVNTTISRL